MESSNLSNESYSEGVSLIVCCYNSREVLPQTLEHIAKQQVPGDLSWEVVIIDNASKDGTGEFADEYWSDLGCDVDFRVIHEATPGLSHARKRAIYSARYPVLVFCDDDNWLDEGYIARAYGHMISDPALGSCGGIGTAVTDGEFPPWFEKYKRAYACGPQAASPGLSSTYLYGAGITMRRDPLRRAFDIGFETQLTGRKGESLSAGEDGELAEWIAMLGYEKWLYDPELKFKHFIKQSRLTWPHLLKLHAGFGKAASILRLYRQARQSGLSSPTATWGYQFVSSIVRMIWGSIKGLMGGRLRVRLQNQWSSCAWLANNRKTINEVREKIVAMREEAKRYRQS